MTVERKVRARGKIPRLPSANSKITRAIDYQLVLGPLISVEPADGINLPIGPTTETKPKAQRYPFVCPDCREMSQWTNGKRIWCSECSPKG